MFPKKLAPVLFGFILSGLMSLLVSGISTFRVTGLIPEFPSLWVSAWLMAWLFAFPIVLLVAPVAHKTVERLTA
jgi:Protein of unknown function (DUF2798)